MHGNPDSVCPVPFPPVPRLQQQQRGRQRCDAGPVQHSCSHVLELVEVGWRCLWFQVTGSAAVRVIAAEGHTRYRISLACCTVHSFVLSVYVYVDGGASMLVARPGAVLAGTGIVFRVCLVCLRMGLAQPCSACSIAARLLLVG